MPRMDDGTLLAILQAEEADAVGYYNSEVAFEQERALDYYYGAPFGDEIEGRSSVVSHDVAEVVDWLLPDLIRIFVSSDEVVKFEPETARDEPLAAQATDYVNYIFWNDNPGFRILHDWIKDALVQKVGVVKAYWDAAEEETRERLIGQNSLALLELSQDRDVEIIDAQDYPVPPNDAHPDGLAFDLTISRRRHGGCVRIVNVPPEEFLISRRSTSIEGSRYVAHRTRKTLSELIEAGFDRDRVMALPAGDDDDLDSRRLSRFRDEDYDAEHGSSVADPAMREVVVMEEYVRVDHDGDGVAELRKITRVANDILDNVEVDEDPFAALCPVPMPHKFFGLGVADQVMDIQRVKSVLWRQMLDNMYLTNNGRTAVNIQNDAVNLDDLLTSRPGGLVRTKGSPAEHIMPLVTPNLSAQAYQMLEYIDGVKESRTGVTRYNQGLDADSLNKTATGINRIMDAAQGRKELIARIFAETGIRTLFRKVLRLVVAYQDAARVIRLRDQWVPMDPRSWNAGMDVSVNVGVGSGNKDQRLAHLATIAAKQEQILLAAGPNNGLVTPRNYYNTLVKMVENADLKSAEPFFTDPDVMGAAPMPAAGGPPGAAQPGVDAMIAAKLAELQLKQSEGQAKLGLEWQKLMLDFLLKAEALRLKHGLDRLDVGGDDVGVSLADAAGSDAAPNV